MVYYFIASRPIIMKINPKNYPELIRLYQQLAQEHETRYAACHAMCNDLLQDTEAQTALRGMEGLCRKLKRRCQLAEADFAANPASYLGGELQELSTQIGRFKRQERLIKKEHATHAPRDNAKISSLLKMFADINGRCQTEWFPALATVCKNKEWDAAAGVILETPFHPCLFDEFPDYCEATLKELCKKIPGQEQLLVDYQQAQKTGWEYYHAIPRDILLAAAVRAQKNILAQEKPAVFAAALKFLHELENEPDSAKWVNDMGTGLIARVAPLLKRARAAQTNLKRLETVQQERAKGHSGGITL